ncbi:PREDICTED: U3 small nucleolar RNA-associated protein 14 homolog A-like [Nanorana parkeri]|uniref:U3 small nucleolar RNA-associated protein 14 homolog A-like n=1 Tax=Nanorana parkeri TaxID=125878 RepID=UPI00085461E1|nr:PREDICTED: U3 small nucleolar RNA-associated protein 14 homolog A-like [Nanorana parkeri]
MEDEEDLFVAEGPLSASEDEEDSDSERKHRKLLEAISSLDGKNRRRLAERTEASLQVSEFGISSEGAGEKISLSDLIAPIKKTASLSTVKKQLNKLKDKKSVELPLSNEETQKIERVISYKNAAEEVAKWDHIVKQNRAAEQLIFPLADETLRPTRIEEKVSGWQARTPLEMEIFGILQSNNQPITDPLLTPREEESLKAMSLEEAKLRRAELQKARALQSFYEAKARREKKIKSKKYHKVLKRGKQKEAIKEFEELRTTNPEAALEELEKLEKTRMEERMSLKHQNSGKWAKSKAIMAKYDEEARKAMQEQLQRNKDLTRKIEVLSESDESEEEETVPDFVNDVQVISEGRNPWMTGKLSSDAKDSGNQEEEEKAQAEAELNTKPEDQDDEEEEEQESEEEVLLKEFEDKRRLRKQQEEQESNDKELASPSVPCAGNRLETSDLTTEAEEKQVSQFNQLFQKLMEQNRKEKELNKDSPAAEPEEPSGGDPEEELEGAEEGPLLMESDERKQTLEDVEALAQEEGIDELATQLNDPGKKKSGEPSVQPTSVKQARKSKLIDHNDVLPVKAKKVRMHLLPTTVEEEDEEMEDDETAQKMIIQEAFAGDDVISDFLKEKQKAEEAGKPKDINLVLPGWGEWGGTNLKVSNKKRSRFIIKAPPAPPRKDQRLPNVIITEKRNIMASAHQVNELPYPFNNRRHFESSIRTPLGKTWNTEKAVHKLTSPRVITKRGHIIEPITEDVFQKHTKTSKADIELNKLKPKPARKPSRKRKPQAAID